MTIINRIGRIRFKGFVTLVIVIGYRPVFKIAVTENLSAENLVSVDSNALAYAGGIVPCY